MKGALRDNLCALSEWRKVPGIPEKGHFKPHIIREDVLGFGNENANGP